MNKFLGENLWRKVRAGTARGWRDPFKMGRLGRNSAEEASEEAFEWEVGAGRDDGIVKQTCNRAGHRMCKHSHQNRDVNV